MKAAVNGRVLLAGHFFAYNIIFSPALWDIAENPPSDVRSL
jgi:hypothetical protein